MSRSAWMLGACGMGVGPLALYLKGDGWEVSGWDDATGSPMELQLANGEVPLLRDPWAAGRRPTVMGRSSAVKPGQSRAHARPKAMACAPCAAANSSPRPSRAGASSPCAAATARPRPAACSSPRSPARGADFGYVLGGLFRDPAFPPARASAASPWVVAEVDESDGTIGAFSPDVTVRGEPRLGPSRLLSATKPRSRPSSGRSSNARAPAVVIPAGNARLERLVAGLKVPVIRVGEAGDYACRLVQGGHSSSVVALGGRFPRASSTSRSRAPSNRSNAALALAVTHFITGGMVAEPLARWRGIRRRQDVLFERTGLRVLADYAAPSDRDRRAPPVGARDGTPAAWSSSSSRIATRARGSMRASSATRSPWPTTPSCCRSTPRARPPSKAAAPTRSSPAPRTASSRTAAPCRTCSTRSPRAPTRWSPSWARATSSATPRPTPRCSAAAAKACSRPTCPTSWPAVSAECVLRANEPLARRTTLGLGGSARWYAEPASVDDLVTLLRAAAELDLRWFVLGRGSNLLVPDEGYDGLILHLDAARWGAVTDLGEGRFGRRAAPAEGGCAAWPRRRLRGLRIPRGHPARSAVRSA
jgi:hypothetical protein